MVRPYDQIPTFPTTTDFVYPVSKMSRLVLTYAQIPTFSTDFVYPVGKMSRLVRTYAQIPTWCLNSAP
jgi:hypothetical protein